MWFQFGHVVSVYIKLRKNQNFASCFVLNKKKLIKQSSNPCISKNMQKLTNKNNIGIGTKDKVFCINLHSKNEKHLVKI